MGSNTLSRSSALTGCQSMSKKGAYGEAGPVLEDVLPPRVAARDPHVIGHHVEDEAHPVPAQRVGEAPEGQLASQLVAQAVVVGDVVAVRAIGVAVWKMGER